MQNLSAKNHALLGFAMLAFVLASAGCEPATSTPGATCRVDTDCPTGETCLDRRCRPADIDAGPTGVDTGPRADSGPARVVTSLRLDPMDVTLTVNPGEHPQQTFSLIATYNDGTISAMPGATYRLESRTLGTIDVASGVFTASGLAGGSTQVRASAPGGGTLMATGTITVRLSHTTLGPGVEPADVASFAPAPIVDAARSAEIVYPLDRAVMPQNVYPADIQWTRGVAGDLFRIELTKPNMTWTVVLEHSGAAFLNHWLLEDAPLKADILRMWRAFAQSDGDAEGTITVTRREASTGATIASTPVHVRFAATAITGSVYYWDIARGRIVRIDDGTATRNEFMPTPPVSVGGSRCVGCHAVSPSGRYMAGRLGGGDNVAGTFDLTTDLTGENPPSAFPIDLGDPGSARWWAAAWNPEENRLFVQQAVARGGTFPMKFAVLDPFTGATIPTRGAVFPNNGTSPAWSPNGNVIAFVANANSDITAFNIGDIGVIPVTGPDTFGESVVIQSGASLSTRPEGGQASSYPSWSMDSEWIAFGHGTGVRSENSSGALYIMRDNGGSLVRLDNATGPENKAYQPKFTPFVGGGYAWIGFLTRRDYGNTLAGSRGRDIQQMWIAAVDLDAPPGTDPSMVPYWIAGQSPTSRNIAPFWAPRACRPDGDSCGVGSECCGGYCGEGTGGDLVCSPTPPDRCRNETETCGTDADCCGAGTSAALICYNHACTVPPS